MKAVIMAGGAGSRLRPLTCNLPKPMVPVMNRPIMEYIVELLRKQDICEIGVTLQYLPRMIQDHFQNGEEFGVRLHYFIEETPLGTAGSVKNAEDFLDDTFVVISGDALTDIDLKKAIDFHREKGAVATLVLKRVEVPLEYGVVITDENGAITRFLEKPSWGEVFSDTVNTGIYILEPVVLKYFEKDREFDFSRDLFPMLLEDNQPMFGYITEDYWCDIGNPQAYLQSHHDFLNGKIKLGFGGKLFKKNVWLGENTEIDPDAVLEGPCFIGSYTHIGKGAHIGPYTVIGENNVIEEGASVKNSVLWNNSVLGKKTEIRGAVVCSGVEIENNVSIFENAVVGDRCRLKERSIIKPDVKIWPEKSIEFGAVVNSNVIWGTRIRKNLFGKDGVCGRVNVDITPQFLVRLGGAFGSLLKPEKQVGVSCDHKNVSVMLKHSLISGLLSTGLKVFDFGKLTTPILRYAVRYFGLDGGVHIFCPEKNRQTARVHFLDKSGASLSPSDERKIENLFARDDFQRRTPEAIKKVVAVHDVAVFYVRNLVSSVDASRIGERKFRLLFYSPGKFVSTLAASILKELGCEVYGCASDAFEKIMAKERFDLGCVMDDNGEEMELYDENGRAIKKEMLLALKGLMCLRSGEFKKVIVPFTAPGIIEKMAEEFNGSVVRTKSSTRAIMEEVLKYDKDNAKGGICLFSLYFDAISTLVRLLEVMATEQKSLSKLIEYIPSFHIRERIVECPWNAKGMVMRSLIEGEKEKGSNVELFEGVKINNDKGWVLILPDSEEPVCRIYSEGFTEEYAQELTDFYEKRIEEIKRG